jgi:Putative prokaryotic signal transducing protein
MTQKPIKQTQETNFVKLATANGLSEADVWKAVLEASGIPVYLRHEALATVVPETTGEIAAVDLWVPRDQAAQAMEILQDERGEPGEEDELT